MLGLARTFRRLLFCETPEHTQTSGFMGVPPLTCYWLQTHCICWNRGPHGSLDGKGWRPLVQEIKGKHADTSYLVVEVIKVARDKNVNVPHDLQNVQALMRKHTRGPVITNHL